MAEQTVEVSVRKLKFFVLGLIFVSILIAVMIYMAL